MSEVLMYRFRALSGRLKFAVRRHKLNKDSLSAGDGVRGWRGGSGSTSRGARRRVARSRRPLVMCSKLPWIVFYSHVRVVKRLLA